MSIVKRDTRDAFGLWVPLGLRLMFCVDCAKGKGRCFLVEHTPVGPQRGLNRFKGLNGPKKGLGAYLNQA